MVYKFEVDFFSLFRWTLSLDRYINIFNFFDQSIREKLRFSYFLNIGIIFFDNSKILLFLLI